MTCTCNNAGCRRCLTPHEADRRWRSAFAVMCDRTISVVDQRFNDAARCLRLCEPIYLGRMYLPPIDSDAESDTRGT